MMRISSKGPGLVTRTHVLNVSMVPPCQLPWASAQGFFRRV